MATLCSNLFELLALLTKDNLYKIFDIKKNLVYKVEKYTYIYLAYIYNIYRRHSRNLRLTTWVENRVALFSKAWKKCKKFFGYNNFDAKIFENYGGKKNNLLYILSLFHKWKIIAVWTFENTEQDPEARPEVWIMQFKMQPINDAKTIIKWQLKKHSFLKMNEYKYIIFYSSMGKIFYKMSSN